ncbi:MAG: hypothetical protein LUC34_03895 [Campylobacter sp.]|nr:hypothetical protein [Campylobacter sp.]
MSKISLIISCTVASIIFAGCGENNIDTVKNYTFPQNKSMSVGTAIDGFNECEKVVWSDESSKDQKIVSAVCVVKNSVLKAEFDAQNAQYQEAVQKEKADNQKHIDSSVDFTKKEFDKFKNENSPQITDEQIIALAKKYCKRVTGNMFRSVECDQKALSDELATTYNLKHDNWAFGNFVFSFSDVANFTTREVKPIWFGEIPKEIKSREYKFSFYINTDKSVSIKDVILTQDGASKNVGAGTLAKVYKR